MTAYSVPFGDSTNNIAEAIALIVGVDWCAQNEYRKIVIEVDSLCWSIGYLEWLEFPGTGQI